jgi:hypothetical protein
MATPIPAFASQYYAGSTDTAQVGAGAVQTLASTRWYYFVSNRTAASNGQSLLKAVKDLLDAGGGGTTFTVTLGVSFGLYRVQISHNNGSSQTITWGAALQAALGFSSSTSVVAAATTVTASYPSPLWWTPDMVVSLTGPTLFDPSVNYGVPTSAGAAQRSSDMTAAYVSNAVQFEAEYTFNGVQYYYKIRPQSGHTNEDLETWWNHGPQLGRRMLMWRDRSNTTGSNAPSEGSASPWNYIEYNPQADLHANLPAVPTAPPKLTFWDVTLKLWVTENGETPLTD